MLQVITRGILQRVVSRLAALFVQRPNGKSLLLHQHFVLSNVVLVGVRQWAVFVTEICSERKKKRKSLS